MLVYWLWTFFLLRWWNSDVRICVVMNEDQPTDVKTNLWFQIKVAFELQWRSIWTCYRLFLAFLTVLPASICSHISPRSSPTALPQCLIMHFGTYLNYYFCALTSFWTSITLGLLYLAIIHLCLAQGILWQVMGNSSVLIALAVPHDWRFCTVLHSSTGLVDNTDETILPWAPIAYVHLVLTMGHSILNTRFYDVLLLTF